MLALGGAIAQRRAVPLISCLTVTLGTPPRLPMLARAIADYAAQTHAERELVIVTDAPCAAAVVRLAEGRADVRIVAVDPGPPLGALRNVAVAAARGELLCQWDDDDRHHPERLAAQLAALGGADACALQEVMLLDADPRELRCINWAQTPAGVHPGTLLVRREALPLYPEAPLGEDLTAWQALTAARPVVRLAGAAHLYAYVAHGSNSWPRAHHALLRDTLSLSRGLLLRREAALREGLAPFGWAGIPVVGSNGPAFTL